MDEYCLFIGWQIRQDILVDIVQPHVDEPDELLPHQQLIWQSMKTAAMVQAVQKMGHMSVGGEL